MVATRHTVRETIANGLRAAVASAQRVYEYQPTDLLGESPVLTVVSTGGRRAPLTPHGIVSEFHFDINVFVVRSDAQWTEHNAQDALDDVEQQIAEWISQNGVNTVHWGALGYAERTSVALFTPQGGETYLWERIPIVVTIYG